MEDATTRVHAIALSQHGYGGKGDIEGGLVPNSGPLTSPRSHTSWTWLGITLEDVDTALDPEEGLELLTS